MFTLVVLLSFIGSIDASANRRKQATKKTLIVTVTAYTSKRGGRVLTRTANGYDLSVCPHSNTIAANFLPFGTKVKIPELFGDKFFVVRDRTAERFRTRVDVWVPTLSAAKKFGKKRTEIVIFS